MAKRMMVGRPTSFARKMRSYNTAMKMFQDLVLDPEYVAMFIARAKTGELHPSLEKMMFEYLLGKPTETLNLNVNDNRQDYSQLTEEQIVEKKVAMTERLLQLRKEDDVTDVDATVN